MYGKCSKILKDREAIQNPRSSKNIFMSELAVRKLLVDLTTPFEKRWCGGDALKSAFFNALTMSLPVGEQFFNDSVHRRIRASFTLASMMLRFRNNGYGTTRRSFPWSGSRPRP